LLFALVKNILRQKKEELWKNSIIYFTMQKLYNLQQKKIL
jgi:hypothetical protein